MGAMTGNTNPGGAEGDKSNVTDRERKGSRKVLKVVEVVAWGESTSGEVMVLDCCDRVAWEDGSQSTLGDSSGARFLKNPGWTFWVSGLVVVSHVGINGCDKATPTLSASVCIRRPNVYLLHDDSQ